MRRSRGFTLIESLAVVAIAGLLAATGSVGVAELLRGAQDLELCLGERESRAGLAREPEPGARETSARRQRRDGDAGERRGDQRFGEG